MWVPTPKQIIVLPDQGQEHMGDVTDKTSRARFALEEGRYVLVFIRGKFVTLSGSGGMADMSLKVDHCDESAVYDFTLKTFPNLGTAGTGYQANVNFRIPADELYLWIVGQDGVLVTEWVNPDPGNIRWALEVGLAYAP